MPASVPDEAAEPVAAAVPTTRTGRQRRAAPVERAPATEDRPEAEVPAAAVVDQERPAAPRRGWWSRFVHKED
jgi:hypothetical protein